ncbi:cholecystokinin receptor type A-like [Saccostrea echinata]|uniref:cholecystokinin receptor type A-like n=1 Tax=Saccostrea echinata TaxID=191078 RepID=UPI002A8067B4|nr:cholecystokinin receptor type A-like [Saccostrea echinata]
MNESEVTTNVTYNGSMVGDLEDWNSQIASDRLLNTVILCLYLTIGVVGNLLVIFVYKSRSHMQTDNRYFILFLAELDLGALIAGVTYSLFLNFYFVLPKDGAVCKVFSFLLQTGGVTSGIVLLYISIQRYKLVCRPTRRQITARHRKIMLAISLAAGAGLSAPISAFYDVSEVYSEERNVTGFECSIVKPTALHSVMFSIYNGILFLATIGILVTMTVLYTFILKSMKKRSATFKERESRRKQLREMADANTGDFSSEDLLNSSSQGQTSSNGLEVRNSQFILVEHLAKERHPRSSMIIDKEDGTKSRDSVCQRNSRIDTQSKQLTKRGRKASYQAVKNHFSTHRYSYIFISISFFFAISYIPTVIVSAIESRSRYFWINQSYSALQIFLILRRMYIFNHIVNPIIYGYFDRSFRREVKKLLRKVLCGLVKTENNSLSDKTSGNHY